jgi:hypothetical protein
LNTSHPVTLPPAQADELASLLDGLLHWLTSGNRQALADLELNLSHHAIVQGSIFDRAEYFTGREQILDTFTTLIAAYVAELDRPDDDEEDVW